MPLRWPFSSQIDPSKLEASTPRRPIIAALSSRGHRYSTPSRAAYETRESNARAVQMKWTDGQLSDVVGGTRQHLLETTEVAGSNRAPATREFTTRGAGLFVGPPRGAPRAGMSDARTATPGLEPATYGFRTFSGAADASRLLGKRGGERRNRRAKWWTRGGSSDRRARVHPATLAVAGSMRARAPAAPAPAFAS